jgi:hypothetical protein
LKERAFGAFGICGGKEKRLQRIAWFCKFFEMDFALAKFAKIAQKIVNL